MSPKEHSQPICSLRVFCYRSGTLRTRIGWEDGLSRRFEILGRVDYLGSKIHNTEVEIRICGKSGISGHALCPKNQYSKFGSLSIKRDLIPRVWKDSGGQFSTPPIGALFEVHLDSFQALLEQARIAERNQRIFCMVIEITSDELKNLGGIFVQACDLDLSKDRDYSIVGVEILEMKHSITEMEKEWKSRGLRSCFPAQ